MDRWTVITSFTYPHEAHVVKSILESYELEVQLKDELTVQADNFYSNAIGGVKLLVRETHYETARKVLLEAGYIKEDKVTPNKFITGFDNFTLKIPVIGRTLLAFRLLVAVALFLLVLTLVIFVLINL